jgi:hypothetical protein
MKPKQSVQTNFDESGQGGRAKLGFILNKSITVIKHILIFTYLIGKC